MSCAGKFSDVICLRTTVRSFILLVHPSWGEGKLRTAGMVSSTITLLLAGQSCTWGCSARMEGDRRLRESQFWDSLTIDLVKNLQTYQSWAGEEQIMLPPPGL